MIFLFLSPSAPPAKGLTLVSQSEFQTLPSYLRLMTLSNLNQAVQNINRFTAQRHGEQERKHILTERTPTCFNLGMKQT